VDRGVFGVCVGHAHVGWGASNQKNGDRGAKKILPNGYGFKKERKNKNRVKR